MVVRACVLTDGEEGPNLTLINLSLRIFGKLGERDLCVVLMVSDTRDVAWCSDAEITLARSQWWRLI